MPSHETIQINLVEIRHQGGSLQLQVGSLTDYVHGTVKNSNGDDVHFSEQAKDIEKWATSHEGIEAYSATIVPPKISLDMLFNRPGFRQTLNLGAVCDTLDLIQEAKASGALGTMFVKGDVETILEQDTEGYEDLTPEEKMLHAVYPPSRPTSLYGPRSSHVSGATARARQLRQNNPT